VERQILLDAARDARQSKLEGCDGHQRLVTLLRCRCHGALFFVGEFSRNRFNFEQWKDDAFDTASTTLAETDDPAVISSALSKARERLVDNPPRLYFIHDLCPRASRFFQSFER